MVLRPRLWRKGTSWFTIATCPGAQEGFLQLERWVVMPNFHLTSRLQTLGLQKEKFQRWIWEVYKLQNRPRIKKRHLAPNKLNPTSFFLLARINGKWQSADFVLTAEWCCAPRSQPSAVDGLQHEFQMMGKVTANLAAGLPSPSLHHDKKAADSKQILRRIFRIHWAETICASSTEIDLQCLLKPLRRRPDLWWVPKGWLEILSCHSSCRLKNQLLQLLPWLPWLLSSPRGDAN